MSNEKHSVILAEWFFCEGGNINMYIAKIAIRGYRNFHDATISFHRGLNVIIGSNNSGKTNLLNAIKLLNQQEKLSFFDFNMNTLKQSFDSGAYRDAPMSIALQFDIRHDINLEDNPTDESILKLSDFLCLTNEISQVSTTSFPVLALISMTYSYNTKLLGKYRQDVATIHNYDEYLKYFRSLINDYTWTFANASTGDSVDASIAKGIFEVEYVRADRSKDLLSKSSTDLYKIALGNNPLDKETITNEIKEIIGTQALKAIREVSGIVDRDYSAIGIDRGNVQIKPIVEFDSGIAQFLRFGVSDTKGAYELPFDNNGLGYNNLIAIYMILLCRDSVNPQIHSVVLLEEPEAHLHPAMQYKLFKYINHLQENDALRQQIFVTTHSSNITAVTDTDCIIDLHYDRESTPNNVTSTNFVNLFCEKNTASKNYIKKFLDVTRSDMLFADSVVLVEGITEKLLLPVFMKKEGFDPDDNHVSIVEMGGKWMSHFLYLFPKERRTRVLCLTDCDYKLILDGNLNTSDYSQYVATHVNALRKQSKGNPYISIVCQSGCDSCSTFEDQLMFDNWSIEEKWRKQLFSLVLPEALITFLETNGFSIDAWNSNLNSIRKDTRESVSKVLSAFYTSYSSTENKAERDKFEALFFSTIFKKYASAQKGDLALSLLTDGKLNAALITPRYIKEGITWLKN